MEQEVKALVLVKEERLDFEGQRCCSSYRISTEETYRRTDIDSSENSGHRGEVTETCKDTVKYFYQVSNLLSGLVSSFIPMNLIDSVNCRCFELTVV